MKNTHLILGYHWKVLDFCLPKPTWTLPFCFVVLRIKYIWSFCAGQPVLWPVCVQAEWPDICILQTPGWKVSDSICMIIHGTLGGRVLFIYRCIYIVIAKLISSAVLSQFFCLLQFLHMQVSLLAKHLTHPQVHACLCPVRNKLFLSNIVLPSFNFYCHILLDKPFL